MGEVKRLREENLRLKERIQALSKEVGQMKLLLQQSSIQLAGEPPTKRGVITLTKAVWAVL